MIQPLVYTDFYKTDHRKQYPKGTTLVYSNFTARGSRIGEIDKTVVFGIQYFIKEYLIRRFNEGFFNKAKGDVVNAYRRRLDNALGKGAVSLEHIEALHDLGYLPIKLKALPEGSLCPMRVPCLTIKNTLPEFFWVTNFLETLLSTVLWLPITSATTAHAYRTLLDKFAKETSDMPEFVDWQGHDFSMRGLAGIEASSMSGAAHLLSFTGTDTIPAIDFLEEYYMADSDKELIGGSVPATEHSVMCMGMKGGEIDTFERLITEVYPQGIVSIVSDTWDYWKVLGEFLPKLKDKIMAREGKVVIRPDSGDPVKIICGSEKIKDLTHEKYCTDLDHCKAWMIDGISDEVNVETPHGECGESNPSRIFKYKDKHYKLTLDIFWNRHDKQYYYVDEVKVESLEEVTLTLEQKGSIEVMWDIFGGTINSKGYKQLDSHIGLIYGDSITLERAKHILQGLKDKGFASTNVVFGIGSYTYQYVTRDTFGFAMKATYGEINHEPKVISKDPKTDDGLKKSALGLLKVNEKYELLNNVSMEEEKEGLLRTVFLDGKIIIDTSLTQIRNTLKDATKE